MARLHIDLTPFFTGDRDWSQFLRLAYQLPPESHFKSAWHDDPEAAREYIRRHPEVLDAPSRAPSKISVPLNECSPEVKMLLALVNEVKVLNANTVSIGSQGKTKKKPDLIPGPKTALDREIARVKQDRLAPMRAALVPVPPTP